MLPTVDGTPRRGFVLRLAWLDLGNGRSPSIHGHEPSFHSLALFVGLHGYTRVALAILGTRHVGPVTPTAATWILYAVSFLTAFAAGAIIDRKINEEDTEKKWDGRRARAFSAGLGLSSQLLSIVHTGGALTAPVVAVIAIAALYFGGVLLANIRPADEGDTGTDDSSDTIGAMPAT
jgi:hypothetical protein